MTTQILIGSLSLSMLAQVRFPIIFQVIADQDDRLSGEQTQ
jgi:hypothetical protein